MHLKHPVSAEIIARQDLCEPEQLHGAVDVGGGVRKESWETVAFQLVKYFLVRWQKLRGVSSQQSLDVSRTYYVRMGIARNTPNDGVPYQRV